MKNRHILIVAKNAREGATYAKRAVLPNFTYRVVRDASAIKGLQSADVHLLDGFDKRPDHGAILGVLRWARDIDYYSVSMPDELEAPAKDQGDGMGEQMKLPFDKGGHKPKFVTKHKSVDSVVEIFDVMPKIETAGAAGDVMPLLETPGAGTDAEKIKAKRRSRCKTCGRLTNADYAVDKDGHDVGAHTKAVSDGFF